MASYQHPYVKQVNRCATVAFSPTSPFIATGTMAGAIDPRLPRGAHPRITEHP